MWHYWLTQRSRPWINQPMVYGWGCGIVDKFSLLTTSANIKLFYLPLSRMKFSGVPFTHICEWKRCSPSSSSIELFGWIFAVVMVALGSASMIQFPCYELEFDSRSNSFSLRWNNNDYFKRYSSVLFQGILWNSQKFPMSLFIFSLPFFSRGLEWMCWGGPSFLYPFFCELGPPFPC